MTQPDLLTTPTDLARPWRVAAETAASDPHYPPSQQAERARYYNDMADRIERGIE